MLLYLVRLSDACGIDLAAAAQAKLRKNAGKHSWGQGRGAQLFAARRAGLPTLAATRLHLACQQLETLVPTLCAFAAKYPAEQCRGSSAKYTAYRQQQQQASSGQEGHASAAEQQQQQQQHASGGQT